MGGKGYDYGIGRAHAQQVQVSIDYMTVEVDVHLVKQIDMP